MNYYIHYLVWVAPKQQRWFVTGPYSEDEALTKRRELARLDNTADAYLSPEAKHMEGSTP